MTELSLIAAMDEAGGIGYKNQLLCYAPADLQYFKVTTMGKPIVMGRTTFESIGKPLPGRVNIILSRSSFSHEGTLTFHSIESLLNKTQEYPELMVIGGAQIYDQTIAIATRLYITKIHHTFNADVFFPKIQEDLWKCSTMEFRARDEKNQYDMTFYVYDRIKP